MKKQMLKCPDCKNRAIKYGKRKNKNQTIQKYKCISCNKIFSLQQAPNKTYPISIILNSISNYNLGYNLRQISTMIGKKYNTEIPISTLSSWISQYKTICTFAKLRKEAINHYTPKNIINKKTLNHIQPYTFKYHNAKLNILIKENPQFKKLEDYIEKINSREFPHHIFTYSNEDSNTQRASQIKFEHLKIKTLSKNNFACKLANLALNLATTNSQRHEAVQNFLLINDSTTIATEIPTYLTNWDAGYYRNQRGFIFPLNNYQTPITGHIDILQIRNGLIHILDYKPEAKKQNPIEQLTTYSLALSRKLNLPLYYFKAAWFDENSYKEFFPLHGIYEKK